MCGSCRYSGKACGSPDDDYAKKWLFAFKQKRYYSGDPKDRQVVVENLGRAMSSLGEDEDRIYLFRNTRAANLTGITNDYVDKSKNQKNADALIGHTLSEETRGLAFNKLVVMKEADGDIKKGTPIILAKDVSEKCYALKPEDYL